MSLPKACKNIFFFSPESKQLIRLLIFKNLLLQILHSYITLYSIPVYSALTRVPPSYTKASPPAPLCRRGAGGEAVPRERENQINTLVLKDINFTINIIELSYYRTIDTLNQSFKMLPWHVYLEAEPVIRNVFLYHSA